MPTPSPSGDAIPTLGELLRRQGRERPDAVAIRCSGESISYRALWLRACRVARALQAAGAGPGSRVVHCGRNDPVYFELLFGAALAGAVLVPLNWRLSGSEVDHVLADAGPVLLVVDAEFHAARAAAQQAGIAVVVNGPDYAAWRDAEAATEAATAVDPDDVALQMYTSGTTGKPKGALLSHRALNVVRVGQTAAWARWTVDDVCLISMPLFHIGGTGTALASLYFGARMVIVREFEPAEFLRTVQEEGITRLFLVPAAIQMLLDHPAAAGTDLSRVKFVSFGSSPMLPPLLARAMQRFDCSFVQVYGLTESAGTVVANPVARGEQPCAGRLRSVGRALAGVELEIRAPDGLPLPSGQPGEVVVRSGCVMTGYWRQTQASQEAFLPGGWLRTGDVGYLDAEGYLYLVDRLKDMIISGGENVYPAEVEAALLELPGVREAAVIGVPDARWGEAVKAVLVLEPAAAFDEQAALQHARRRLAGYKVPKSIELRDALPRNAAGKVLRRALRDPYWAASGRRI